MSHRILESADAVILAPATPASASVIWLHGLGADGHDFVPIVPELRLPPAPGIRFVFPHAGVRPVTLNMGMRMRAWYDIKTLTAEGRADEPGLRGSIGRLGEMIAAERAAGIASERRRFSCATASKIPCCRPRSASWPATGCAPPATAWNGRNTRCSTKCVSRKSRTSRSGCGNVLVPGHNIRNI
jgi:hypothetical protein